MLRTGRQSLTHSRGFVRDICTSVRSNSKENSVRVCTILVLCISGTRASNPRLLTLIREVRPVFSSAQMWAWVNTSAIVWPHKKSYTWKCQIVHSDCESGPCEYRARLAPRYICTQTFVFYVLYPAPKSPAHDYLQSAAKL